MIKKLVPLSAVVQSMLDRKEKRECGLEYFYLDETAFTFPIFIPAPNPHSQLGVPPNAKVIQLNKYQLIVGNLTIYIGNIPSEEEWVNPKTTEPYYFAYQDELEPWFKQNQ